LKKAASGEGEHDGRLEQFNDHFSF
jgi:hypothetical protein